MDPVSSSNIVPSIGVGVRGSFRGRGAGMGSRGGFDRGRGRPMPGRVHFMGSMGRGGMMGMGVPNPPQGMIMPGRGMRLRGPPAFPMRAGFMPRNGPSMRGVRHSTYPQPTKQHTGAENNKTVSPASNTVIGTSIDNSPIATTSLPGPSQQVGKTSVLGENIGSTSQPELVKHNSGPKTVTNGNSGTTIQGFSRGGRGRGGHYVRGGLNGRGGYNQNSNISGYNNYGGAPNTEQGQMNARRGSLPRGRGGYGQGMQRPLMNQQQMSNSQSTSLVPLKRGAPTGPGSKRGRYEGTPYAQRTMAPNYHHSQSSNISASIPPHSGYAIPPSHQTPAPPPATPSHTGYSSHDSGHIVDPYTQQYNTAQSNYNGYGQNNTYAPAAQGVTANTPYVGHSGLEYDQSQYQNYSYASQQDGRYQSYNQDYSQQYASTGIDYNNAQQTDYSQHQTPASSTVYDERNFAGYDATYQQNYSNPAGYY